MQPTPPAAYFLTFITYGSRVPGEPGAVSRKSNGYGEPRASDHDRLAASSRALMAHDVVLLDQPMRTVTEASIRQHCDHRGWMLHALNVRTNHVHAVVTAEDSPAADVLAQLKARSTRVLREQSLAGAVAPVWARHGSTRMVWKEADLEEVVDYVLYRQGVPLT